MKINQIRRSPLIRLDEARLIPKWSQYTTKRISRLLLMSGTTKSNDDAAEASKKGGSVDMMSQMIKEAWTELNLWERISLVITIPCLIILMIAMKVSQMFSTAPLPPSEAPEKRTEDLYQLYYRVPNEGCYTTVIRDPKTKTLLLHSPPPCTPEAIAHVKTLGTVHVIVVPSTAHDIHGKAWKEKFPNATLLAHPKTPPLLSYEVDETYDTPKGKELLQQYRVVEVFDVDDYQRFPDAFWLISAPGPAAGQERHIVLASCGFMGERNKRISSLMYTLGRWGGCSACRYTLHGSLIFIKGNTDNLLQQWKRFCTLRPSIDMIIFQHGEPMVPKRAAEEMYITRNPFR